MTDPSTRSQGIDEHHAIGFRNLTNYITRSLLESGDSDPDYTLSCEALRNRPILRNSMPGRILELSPRN